MTSRVHFSQNVPGVGSMIVPVMLVASAGVGAVTGWQLHAEYGKPPIVYDPCGYCAPEFPTLRPVARPEGLADG